MASDNRDIFNQTFNSQKGAKPYMNFSKGQS